MLSGSTAQVSVLSYTVCRHGPLSFDLFYFSQVVLSLRPRSSFQSVAGSRYLFCQTILCRAPLDMQQEAPCHVAVSPLQVFRDCDDDDDSGEDDNDSDDDCRASVHG